MPAAISSTNDASARAFSILTRVAADRACVYRWLALGLYAPDTQLIDALSNGRLVDEIEAATAWLGSDQERLWPGLSTIRCRAATLAELAEVHARLFGKSVDRIPARESAYRWRDASDLLSAADAVAQTLRQQYAQFNAVPIDSDDDHVAVELEFLVFLCEREAMAWASSAHETARQLRRQQRAFLDDHLGRWLAEFCRRVCEAVPDTFYAGLAALADAWLNLEHGPGYLPAVKRR